MDKCANIPSIFDQRDSSRPAPSKKNKNLTIS